MFIPSLLLKQLYTFGSLENTPTGVQFAIKNLLSDASFAGLIRVQIDGEVVPLEDISLDFGSGDVRRVQQISPQAPVDFPLRKIVTIQTAWPPLSEGKHKIEITFQSKPFGKLSFSVDDAISARDENRVLIPRDPEDDYTLEIVKARQEFVEAFTGQKLVHIPQFSFESQITQGNIEHFTGVAQVPLGFAGPLQINGEHAQGEFLIPLATTEGTLVASYNRGMKVLNLCGGVTCTVTGDAMQRAPVFVFEDGRVISSIGSMPTWSASASRPRPPPVWRNCCTSILIRPISSPSCASTSLPAMPPDRIWLAGLPLQPVAGFWMNMLGSRISFWNRIWPPIKKPRRSTS